MSSEQDHDNIPTALTESLEDDEDDVTLLDDDVSIAVPGPTTAVSVPVRSEPNNNNNNNNNNMDQRRLFQKLWTDEDEIELLQGFLEYNNQRVGYNTHHDTTAFYELIKNKLQLDFNKNQLVEKLRRLKKKYRNVVNKLSCGKDYVFKTAHDQVTFQISSKIWSNDRAVLANTPVVAVNDVSRFDEDDGNGNGNGSFAFNLNESNGNGGVYPSSAEKKVGSRKRVRSGGIKVEEKVSEVERETVVGGSLNLNQSSIPSMVEEAVKSCLLPLFKELVEGLGNGGSRGVGLRGMNLNLDPFSLNFGGLMNFPFGDAADERWRKQHILELEVCSKRLELVQDQIKSQLEELRSVRR